MKKNNRRLSVDRIKAINAKILEADKKALIRKIRRLIITLVSIFLVVFAGYGVYAWYSGNQPLQVVEEEIYTGDQGYQKPDVAPTKPAPDAKVGVSTQSFSGTARPGEEVSLSVRTKAEAICTITVTYNEKEKSSSVGLIDKKADEYGIVRWSWDVDSYAPEGKWPAEVTCRDSIGQSAYLKLELIII